MICAAKKHFSNFFLRQRFTSSLYYVETIFYSVDCLLVSNTAVAKTHVHLIHPASISLRNKELHLTWHFRCISGQVKQPFQGLQQSRFYYIEVKQSHVKPLEREVNIGLDSKTQTMNDNKLVACSQWR